MSAGFSTSSFTCLNEIAIAKWKAFRWSILLCSVVVRKTKRSVRKTASYSLITDVKQQHWPYVHQHSIGLVEIWNCFKKQRFHYRSKNNLYRNNWNWLIRNTKDGHAWRLPSHIVKLTFINILIIASSTSHNRYSI